MTNPTSEDSESVPKGMKAIKRYGKTYLVKDYPSEPDRTREALNLVRQDNLAVTKNIWLEAKQQTIDDELEVAREAVRICERDCEMDNNSSSSLAKRVGADMNMLNALSKQVIRLHDELKQREAELAHDSTGPASEALKRKIAELEEKKAQTIREGSPYMNRINANRNY
jgi:hypothetical protein